MDRRNFIAVAALPTMPRIAIAATKDRPYAVTGGAELAGISMGDGASAEHFILCRCGASKNKPFCDGSHWDAGFRDG